MYDAPYRFIPLYARGGGVRAYTMVDAADYAFLSQWGWCMSSTGYARRSDGGRFVLLHRVVMGVDGLGRSTGEVDHRNRNPLDNRRSNLRLVRGAENRQNLNLNRSNRSGYRQVHWDSERNTWRVRVRVNGRKQSLGRFDSAEEAGRVAQEWRRVNMPYATD